MNVQVENSHFLYDAEPSGDEEILLLEEVDFKWLMAGQGWWIDTTRLHSDPSYAARFYGWPRRYHHLRCGSAQQFCRS